MGAGGRGSDGEIDGKSGLGIRFQREHASNVIQAEIFILVIGTTSRLIFR
jgi:hypothetical protein